MDRSSRRVTYANVTSTLALIVAVSGGVAVAADKIDGKNIKKNTITSKQVKNSSLTATDLAPTTLATINAASVDGKSAVCTAGTVEFVGGCWETATTPSGSWFLASEGCAARGGDLPSIGPLIRFGVAKSVSLSSEWVNDLSYDGGVPAIRTFKVTSGPIIQNAALEEAHNYRCVLPLVR